MGNKIQLRREWEKRRNKKALLKRTKRKLKKKQKATLMIQENRNFTPDANYKKREWKFSFSAPEQLSLIHNTNETVEYFQSILSFIKRNMSGKRKIFLDISSIKILTIDALMYLMAIFSNLKKSLKDRYEFSGNFPSDVEISNLLLDSGFKRYVVTNKPIALRSAGAKIEIRTNNKIDTRLARDICDFVTRECEAERLSCRFIYAMMIELMENTRLHAYANNVFLDCWYVFVERKENLIKFSFVDTGNGIPSTVNKNFRERIDILGLTKDGSYIKSALLGDYRTQTKEKNRGKGLPEIYKYSQEGKIQNLYIVSGKGTVYLRGGDSHIRVCPEHTNFSGTMMYWEIDINNYKEEQGND